MVNHLCRYHNNINNSNKKTALSLDTLRRESGEEASQTLRIEFRNAKEVRSWICILDVMLKLIDHICLTVHIFEKVVPCLHLHFSFQRVTSVVVFILFYGMVDRLELLRGLQRKVRQEVKQAVVACCMSELGRALVQTFHLVQRLTTIRETELRKLLELQQKVRQQAQANIVLRACCLPEDPIDFDETAARFFQDPKTSFIEELAQQIPTSPPHSLRMQAISISERKDVERFRKVEIAKRRQRLQNDFLQAVLKHSALFWAEVDKRKVETDTRNSAILKHHELLEKRRKLKEDRQRKQRMAALKANDIEAYSRLLDRTKTSHLAALLDRTKEIQRKIQERTQRYGSTMATEDEGKPLTQPAMMTGGLLRHYQLLGLHWMLNLDNLSLNGILADEMGLGKTIQVISLVAHLLQSHQRRGPFLIIVPLSTISNWESEFKLWTPSVDVCVYAGAKVERKRHHEVLAADPPPFHVCLTTYNFVQSDAAKLKKCSWDYIIVDEGHRLKNTQSKLVVTLRKYYSSKHRLILTGTPVQNSLQELWSLMNFLLPDVFDSWGDFNDWFNRPFESAGLECPDLEEEEKLIIISSLHEVLRPFMLRRLKSTVAAELPEKEEIIIKTPLSGWQAFLYESIQSKEHSASFSVGMKVMQLRKVCCHPYLFAKEYGVDLNEYPKNEDLVRASGKFSLLYRLLPKLHKSGHRTLLFFQMTTVMDIFEDFLSWANYDDWLRLDGSSSTTERKELLRSFNDPKSKHWLFLLSTRAGGLGLNLQTADTDWNPQMDRQAADRAHRIGQTKTVRIFRLVTAGTIEEDILNVASHKLCIDHAVVTSGDFHASSPAKLNRHAVLKEILERGLEKNWTQRRNNLKIPNLAELNLLSARNEEELELFNRIDQEWPSADAEPTSEKWLIPFDQIPPLFRTRPQTQMLEVLDRGSRGLRKMQKASYEDISERDFIQALETGMTPDEYLKEKKKNSTRQEKKAARKCEETSAKASASHLPPSASSSVAGNTNFLYENAIRKVTAFSQSGFQRNRSDENSSRSVNCKREENIVTNIVRQSPKHKMSSKQEHLQASPKRKREIPSTDEQLQAGPKQRRSPKRDIPSKKEDLQASPRRRQRQRVHGQGSPATVRQSPKRQLPSNEEQWQASPKRRPKRQMPSNEILQSNPKRRRYQNVHGLGSPSTVRQSPNHQMSSNEEQLQASPMRRPKRQMPSNEEILQTSPKRHRRQNVRGLGSPLLALL
eukprot:g69818.t1